MAAGVAGAMSVRKGGGGTVRCASEAAARAPAMGGAAAALARRRSARTASLALSEDKWRRGDDTTGVEELRTVSTDKARTGGLSFVA